MALDFLDVRHYKVGRSSAVRTGRLYPRRNPWYFQRLSRPQGTWFRRGEPRKKSPVTPPGIDPGTVRLVAQCLNHYPTPGPWNTRRLLRFCENLVTPFCHVHPKEGGVIFDKVQLFLTLLHGAIFGRFYNENFNSNITVSYLSNISTSISPPSLAFSGPGKRPLILPIRSMSPNNQCKEEST